jgi:hypothetical protein
MCEKTLYYNEDVKSIIKQTRVPLGQRVNGFTVKNAGTTLLIMNGEVLQPGDSKATGGNRGEEYTGRCDINFQVPVPAPAVITNQGYVTIKFYVDAPGFDNS